MVCAAKIMVLAATSRGESEGHAALPWTLPARVLGGWLLGGGRRGLGWNRRALAARLAVSALILAVSVSAGCQSTPAAGETDGAPKKGASEAADTGATAKGPATPSGAESSGTESSGTESSTTEGPDGRESLSPPGGRLPGGVLAQLKGRELQADRQIADHYFEVGKRYFRELDYQRAYDNLKRALMLNPAHVEARRLYHEAGAVLGVRQDELETNLERWGREQRVKVQLLRQEMVSFYEAGEKAFNGGEYDQAIKDFERVEQIVAYSAYEIDPGQGEGSYRQRARQLIAEAKQRKLRSDLESREQKEQAMRRAALHEEHDLVQRRQERLRTMLDQAAELIRMQRYAQGRDLADQVLEIEPQSRIAKKLRGYAVDGIHLLTARNTTEARIRETESNWLEVEKAGVPKERTYIDFPKDWIERTKYRKPGIGTSETGEPIWVRNIKKILKDRKVSLDFKERSLQDVVLFLQDITNLNFVIAADVDAESLTVTLRLKKIQLENALEIIVKQVGLSYYFDKESIIIAPPDSQPGNVRFEVYEVSDLLLTIKDFTAPRMHLPDPDKQQGGQGGNNLIFGGSDSEEDQGEAITGETLVEIIKGATGGDDVWDDPMQIEAHKGQLLVTATPEILKKVLDVLEKIRRNQGWFVHIEVRFIDMTNDTLEDFGLDFRGLGGNPGDETTVRGQPNPNPIFPTGPTNQLGTPVDFGPFNRNVGGTDAGMVKRPGNVAGGFGRNFGPGLDNFVFRTQNVFGNAFGPVFGQRLQGGGGLSLQIAKLSPFQINAILRAEYEGSKVTQLTAPRVTAANREKVYVSVVTQRAYISDWDLVSGGTGLTVIEVPDPVVDTLQEGVVLEVRPTISSDRKYVTLDCRPSLATLVGGQINTVIVNLGAVSMAAIAVPIGIPEITLQQAFTSVTIPDGGTALLGGFRQINERREESSMPFIDNIPFLNLFFRRKGHVNEQRSLVMLVTAKIMNIRDEERRRFNKN